MSMVKITFPNGESKEFSKNVTGLAIAMSLSEGLAREALAIKVNSEIWDLSRAIDKDANVQILTFKDKEGIEVFRHSSAHILADAVMELFPDAKPTIGPAVDDGFYYDFDVDPFTPDDLPKIEAKMKEIVKRKESFTRQEISKKEALVLFKNNKYKIEMISALEDDKITVYKHGNYVDLCRGPHVQHTGQIKALKVTKLAGAYWRGDAQNEMLQRVYGVSFPDKKDLAQYNLWLEEAEKRDHRKIGKELDLFVFSDLVGPGLPLYTPNGTVLRNNIVNYSKELNHKCGYCEVHTPNMNKAELFKISGHYDKFKDDMLEVRSHYSKEEYFLKPMNCPQHCQIFASKTRSYKDLPIRYSDFANLYRDEKPGELAGLSRLRCFSQDDGHSFCREDQIKDEFNSVLEVIQEALKTYGLNFKIRLSLWDPKQKEKYLGDESTWEDAQKILRELLVESKMEFTEAEGEAAFYGPKMDVTVTDALNREWQISTIQLDLNMPKRFGLKYAAQDGTEKTPIMIHRALVGSPERFMSIIIEHTAGRFPLWLSPRQVSVLSVSEKSNDFAEDVRKKLFEAGLRVDLDTRTESIPKKVRNAQLRQTNYILVVGEKDIEKGTITPRTREGTVEPETSLADFIVKLKKEVSERRSL